jgi:hypothetical protein
VQVTVKEAPETVAGARVLVKIALMAELPGTPGVGPGVVVNGLVNNTRGRVRSGGVVAATVVNFHEKGAAISRPLARLVAPLRVAVYGVAGVRRVPGVSVNVAIVCVASRLTVPVASAHGAAQDRVKLAVPVIGETGSFNVAETEAVVTSTPTAPFAGVSAVTKGTSAAVPTLPKI